MEEKEEIKDYAEDIVEDTDADTKDVIEEIEDDQVEDVKGNKEILAAIDSLKEEIANMIDNLNKAIIGGGFVVREDEAAVTEEIVEEAYEMLEDLDYTI